MGCSPHTEAEGSHYSLHGTGGWKLTFLNSGSCSGAACVGGPFYLSARIQNTFAERLDTQVAVPSSTRLVKASCGPTPNAK